MFFPHAYWCNWVICDLYSFSTTYVLFGIHIISLHCLPLSPCIVTNCTYAPSSVTIMFDGYFNCAFKSVSNPWFFLLSRNNKKYSLNSLFILGFFGLWWFGACVAFWWCLDVDSSGGGMLRSNKNGTTSL